MKVPASLLRGAIRFSLSRDNTIDDVVCVLNLLPEIIARLRLSSPSWQQHADVGATPSFSTELVP
jgi:cysteine desulfurase